jgi:hypothetical protein
LYTSDGDGNVDGARLKSLSGCLLFFPQVIYEHGELGWNDINRGKLLIRPAELWLSYQQIHLVARHKEMAKEMMNLAYKISL